LVTSSAASAGETARDQAERRQRRVPAADLGVGAEDPVSGLARRLVKRGPRVGDNDDVVGGVASGLGERVLVRAPLAVGLDRPTGLAGHDHDRLVQLVVECARDVVGV
jgi:hypothetical protein